MSIKSWKRSRDDSADAGRASTNATDGTPHQTLSQLAATYDAPVDQDAKAAHYNDWAERMREKRVRTRLLQGGESIDGTPPPAGIHWSTEGLFEESRRVDEEEQRLKPNPWQVRELLAVLDLREDATTVQIGDAYRRLAKRHHPDRYATADEDTREFHAEKMRGIIDAYQTLKTLEKSSL